MIISVNVNDPEITGELTRVGFLDVGAGGVSHASVDGQQYADAAFRVGILALRGARGEVDAQAIKARLDEAIATISVKLKYFADVELATFGTSLAAAMKTAGADTERDIDKVLNQFRQLHSLDIDQVMRPFLAPDAAIFKLLSPTETTGVIQQLRSSFEKTREALIKDIETKVLAQFSRDNAGSAITRLEEIISASQRDILKQFTFDDPQSALRRLHESIGQRIEGLAQLQQTFQTEVRTTLATLTARKEEAARTTSHGVTYEDAVGAALETIVRGRHHHIFEATGKTTGLIRNCKVADFVITLNDESVAAGARIAVEAKAAGGYQQITKLLEEAKLARDNRGAQLTMFVIDPAYAGEDWPALDRQGETVIVKWSPDEGLDDKLVAAFSVCCALAVRTANEKRRSKVDYAAIELASLEVRKRVQTLDDVTTWTETIRSSADKILDRIRIARTALNTQVEVLLAQVEQLKG